MIPPAITAGCQGSLGDHGAVMTDDQWGAAPDLMHTSSLCARHSFIGLLYDVILSLQCHANHNLQINVCLYQLIEQFVKTIQQNKWLGP